MHGINYAMHQQELEGDESVAGKDRRARHNMTSRLKVALTLPLHVEERTWQRPRRPAKVRRHPRKSYSGERASHAKMQTAPRQIAAALRCHPPA